MFSRHGVFGRARKALFVSTASFAVLMGSVPSAFAVSANPNPFSEVQPDGTQITLRVRGDEHFNWAEDRDGFTVLQSKGWYEYARLNPQGRLVPSGLKVGLNNPRAYGLTPGILPSKAQRAASAKGVSGGADAPDAQGISPSGAIKNLVVLIRFSNHTGRTLPSNSDVNVLFNAPGGDAKLAPTGSVRDVYLQNSYGKMQLNSDISPWITVSGTEQYYANGSSGDSTLWQALREALNELDKTVDFRQYDTNNDGYIDSIAFLHSGYAAEWGGTDAYGTGYRDRIWSHRWAIQNPAWVSAEGVVVSSYHISPAVWGTSGSDIGRIGVIAHETGHFFGLPDLYDTDGGGQGIGSYGLMANSWDFSGSQLCPPHFSPWSKKQLGWITPTVISQPGQYSIGQSETTDDYVMISAGYASNEYLMIENRQRAGFDCSLPQGGLAIWHIDDQAGYNTEGYPGSGRWPEDGKHYRVALLQADGNFNLEKGNNRGDAGDVHHAAGVDAIAPGPYGYPNTDGYQSGRITNTGHTIYNISSSGSVMTFCLNDCGGGDPLPTDGFAAPTNLAATVSKSGKGRSAVVSVRLNWKDNSSGTDNEDSFVIERCEETGKRNNKTCNFSQHATVGRDVTSFSESPGSGTYKYRVKARKNSGEQTGYSNEVKI